MERTSESAGGPRAERLRELVVEVLEGLERGGFEALEEACRDHPDLAGGLRRRISALVELGLVQGAPTRTPERVGEFRLLERIGVGGMGVVYRAVQESLGREVALKLIRPDVLHQDEARERFARETAIIASLQHPGIVPIFTVGDDPELPWYAMEHVPGCTLAEALADLAGRDPDELSGSDLLEVVRARVGAPPSERPSPLFAGSYEATALRVVRQVADALEHAHARGVLHRDLKPSNVMLTPEGRVMLVDFGLSSSGEGDGLTRTGDHVGSLPYMPPELLRDGPRALDRRSDVYALGVTLYEVLTLHTPFPGESAPARMAKILEGLPARPRSHVPGLSWEAETVCLAAIDRDPRRRYATAADFARDLDNAVERRPVEARRASALLVAKRFVQRRPGAAAALALAALLPTVVALLLARESRNVSAALTVARDEQQRAEASFRRSVQAVESMLHNLGETALDHVPGMDGVRKTVLDDAAALYAELLVERPDDLELALLAVDCEVLRAELDSRVGQASRSEAGLRRALDWLEPWADGGPGDARRARAYVLLRLGDSVVAAGRVEESSVLHADALELLRELRAEDPSDAEATGMLVELLGRTLSSSRTRGRTGSMPPEFLEIERAARGLLGDGEDPRTVTLLARTLEYQGEWSGMEGDPATALERFREAFDLYARALELAPGDEEARYRLAGAAADVSSLQAGVGDREASLESARIAVDEIERVLADFPGVDRFELRGAKAQLNLGIALNMAGRRDEGAASLERAIELHLALLEEEPAERAALHRSVGTAYLNLASSLHGAGELGAALDACARSRDHLEAACAAFPDDSDMRSWLALERRSRAGLLLAAGRIAEATEALVGVDRLAAHRTDRLHACLERLGTCVTHARESGDAEVVRRSEEAARRIVAAVLEREDMAGNGLLLALAETLDVR